MTATNETKSCPYCQSDISSAATRCPHCAGEMRHCWKCRQVVGLTTKQKFVGWMRGGTKTQYRCMTCNEVLDGPRF